MAGSESSRACIIFMSRPRLLPSAVRRSGRGFGGSEGQKEMEEASEATAEARKKKPKIEQARE